MTQQPDDRTMDRRRTPRVDLLADVQGHIVTLDERVHVTQLGPGGMTVETTAPLSPRLLHDFRISLGSLAVTVRGFVIHSRVSVQDDSVAYVSGIQFAEPSADALEAIGRIIDDAGLPPSSPW